MGIRIYYAKRQKTEPTVIKNQDLERQPIISQLDPFMLILNKLHEKSAAHVNFAKIVVYGGDKYVLCAPTENTTGASEVYNISVSEILKLFKEGTIRTVPGYKNDMSWLTVSTTIALVRCGFWAGMQNIITSQPQVALSVMALSAPTYYALEMLRYRANHRTFPHGIAHQQLVADVGRVSMKIFSNLIGWKVGDDAASYFDFSDTSKILLTGAGAAVGTMMTEYATNRSDKITYAYELERAATALGIKFDAEKFDMEKLLQLTQEQLNELVAKDSTKSLDDPEFSKSLLASLRAAFNKNLITLGLRAFTAGAVWTALGKAIPENFLAEYLHNINIAKPVIDSVATATSFWASGAIVESISDSINKNFISSSSTSAQVLTI